MFFWQFPEPREAAKSHCNRPIKIPHGPDPDPGATSDRTKPMRFKFSKQMMNFLPHKAVGTLFLLAALSLEVLTLQTQAGFVVSGDTLILPVMSSTSPGNTVTYSFDQSSGFFQSNPGAQAVPYVTNDTTFTFFASLLDLSQPVGSQLVNDYA